MATTNDPSNISEGAGKFEVRHWWIRIIIGKRPIRTLVRMTILAVVAFVTAKYCFQPIRVTGISMEPTYHNGRVNVLNLLAYHHRDPKRGDVIGVRLREHRMILMKRVLGLPGERVGLTNGIVIINGTPLKEDYARGHEVPPIEKETLLAPNEYFIIGDNRDVSEYGIVNRDEILGKILF